VSPYTSSATYYSSCRLARAGSRAKLSVIWLGGEHDIATKDVLAAVLAEAIALDEPAVVIDLSGVHFISAATIGVIVGAKTLLARRGRSLFLRAPPPFVRRVFDLCGLSELLDRDPSADVFETVEEAAALRTWVEVPATSRVDWHETPVTSEPNVAERVSVESAPAERPLIVRIP
jgi:anti-anti-sigma factor